MPLISAENNLKKIPLNSKTEGDEIVSDSFSENLIKLPQKKNLFGEKIILNDVSGVDTYPEDISRMFHWMKQLNFPPRPTIIDVGANIGMFSLSYASMFKNAEVHSFEPVPFIYKYLNKNLKLNPNLSSNIYTHNLGLSNSVEQKQLSIPAPHQHERYNYNLDIRLYSVLGQGRHKINAKFMPLDLWVDRSHIKSLDFIKIDVEGYEYLVLEGAKETLKSFKPIVMFELNDMTITLSNRTADEYLHFAQKIGYQVFGLEYGFKSELLEINSLEQVDLVSDLILIPSL